MRKNLPLLALVAAMVIGGLGNTLLATSPDNPWLLLSARFLFAGLISIPLWKNFRTLTPLLMLASILEVASVIFLVLGLSNVSVAFATLIGSMAPIISIAVNKLSGHQHLPKGMAIPMLLGLVGTIIVASQKPFTMASVEGIVLVFISLLCGTSGSIINGLKGKDHSQWVRVGFTNAIGGLALLPIMVLSFSNGTGLPSAIWIPALVLAIFPGTIAKAFNLYALKHLPVPVVLQGQTLAIISASMTAWLILGQSLNWISGIGILVGMLSVVSLAFIVLKDKKLNEEVKAS